MHGYHIRTIIDGLITRIERFDDSTLRETAVQRFQEEIFDGANHCTNGFMVRMCNVLIGLDDNIAVRMNASEILQARIPKTMEVKRNAGNWIAGEEPWQWSRDCFIETIKDLDDCDVFEVSELGLSNPLRLDNPSLPISPLQS